MSGYVPHRRKMGGGREEKKGKKKKKGKEESRKGKNWRKGRSPPAAIISRAVVYVAKVAESALSGKASPAQRRFSPEAIKLHQFLLLPSMSLAVFVRGA